MNDRLRESAAIWITHGPLDAISTIAAARTVGIGVEANPIVGELLRAGELPTIVGICACVAVAAAVWPAAADSLDAPPWVAGVITAVGVLVFLGNLSVVAL
jgi:hypothetical protein